MKHFDDEFAALQSRMREMSNNALSMFRLVETALEGQDGELSGQIEHLEDLLDQTQVEIDKQAVRLMTMYSPVAGDLRGLIVMMHITSQLERVGDQVVNICECLNLMDSQIGRAKMTDLIDMVSLVGTMLEDAVNSYFRQDIDLARRVWSCDDLVDAKNAQIIKKLLSDKILRRVLDGVDDVADLLALILLARHFERIADQSTNICKEVIYLVEGHDVRHTDRT